MASSLRQALLKVAQEHPEMQKFLFLLLRRTAEDASPEDIETLIKRKKPIGLGGWTQERSFSGVRVFVNATLPGWRLVVQSDTIYGMSGRLRIPSKTKRFYTVTMIVDNLRHKVIEGKVIGEGPDADAKSRDVIDKIRKRVLDQFGISLSQFLS